MTSAHARRPMSQRVQAGHGKASSGVARLISRGPKVRRSSATTRSGGRGLRLRASIMRGAASSGAKAEFFTPLPERHQRDVQPFSLLRQNVLPIGAAIRRWFR